MNKKIDRMKNHTIICGYGRTGSRVATELEIAGHSFVVVENDREVLELLETQNIPHVVGDATEGRLTIRFEDQSVRQRRAIVNALVITPSGGGDPMRFDFGTRTVMICSLQGCENQKRGVQQKIILPGE